MVQSDNFGSLGVSCHTWLEGHRIEGRFKSCFVLFIVLENLCVGYLLDLEYSLSFSTACVKVYLEGEKMCV